MQNLWKFKLYWNHLLPANVMERWVHVTTLFKQIPLIKIPRLVGSTDESAIYQLLIFCGASMKAYSASVYLRIKEKQELKPI